MFGPGSLNYSSPLILPRLSIFEAILTHDPDSTVVVDSPSGQRFTYGSLPGDVCRTRHHLQNHNRRGPPDGSIDDIYSGRRVAFMVDNGYDFIVNLLAIFACRAVAVPLSPSFPVQELKYIMDQSQASALVCSVTYNSKGRQLMEAMGRNSPVVLVRVSRHTDDGYSGGSSSGGNGGEQAFHTVHRRFFRCGLKEMEHPDEVGMMLYTSGTTSRPKGVLVPLSVLAAQCWSLIEAWRYTSKDHLLHVLPLHHIHGIVNAVLAPLYTGSTIEFLHPFNAEAVWDRLAAPFLVTDEDLLQQQRRPPRPRPPPITFFTAVPTVYSRLLSAQKLLPEDVLAAARKAISPRHMRVAISGSAALPTPVKQAWKDLSHGNVLLERYGMTEIGMALSCGLDFADRVDGSVGWPLPGVEVCLVDVDADPGSADAVIRPGEEIGPDGRERVGEIRVRGPTLFKEYWRNPDAMAADFVDAGDGGGPWFKTGDVAVRRAVPGAGNFNQNWACGPMYFIQGRMSADIIKTGGEKVSALEVERELLSLAEVAEAAVLAVPSGRWGQKVGAVVVLDPDATQTWSPMDMRRALRNRLANYKIPQLLRVVNSIPRNAMGKINKKELVAVFAEDFSEDEA